MMNIGKVAEEAWKLALQYVDDIIYVVRLDSDSTHGTVELVSDEVRRVLGHEPEDFYRNNGLWFELVHPEDVAELGRSTAEIYGSGKPGMRTYRLRHKTTGEYRWMEDRCAPQFDASGGLVRVVGVARDVTHLRETERALRDSEEQLRALFEGSPDAIVASDKSGTIRSVNGEAERLLGYSREELVGQPLELLVPEQFRTAHVQQRSGYHQNPHRRPSGSLDLLIRHRDGREIPVDISLNFVQSGQNQTVVSTIRDLTQVREIQRQKESAEHQLREAAKIEAIGRLAGGVAHDFNNLLMVIHGHTDLLLMQVDKTSPIYESLAEIRQAGRRAAELTHQLLAFGRKQPTVMRALHLGEIVEQSISMLRPLLGANVKLSVVANPDARAIKGDVGQLHQVLMNLALNARDSMPDGGQLTIGISNFDLASCDMENCPDIPPGEYVELTVTDTGTGMDGATLAHIFEPFFTTKLVGQGTGLGLATVYGIVKQAGGFIHVESTVGRGTSFRIRFPQMDEAASLSGGESKSTRAVAGTETILLVEDQPQLRALVAGVLRDSGYTVIEAAEPDDAKALLKSHTGQIHLLLTDIVMPGMNGHELAHQLHESRPGMKVLYMSGYSERVVSGKGLLQEGEAFLQKPISMHDLTTSVSRILHNGWVQPS